MFSVIYNPSLLSPLSAEEAAASLKSHPQSPPLTPESGKAGQASYDPSTTGGSPFLDLSSAVKASSPLSQLVLALHHFMLLSRDHLSSHH